MGAFADYVGNKNISADKKDEFNRNMLKLFNMGGMVQMEMVSMHGKRIHLIRPVELSPDGTAYFQYNYFEDEFWDIVEYDAESTYLQSRRIGYNEFCDVMVSAYFLYECYQNRIGYVVLNGTMLNATYYVGWINQILDEQYSLHKRYNVWNYMEDFALSRLKCSADGILTMEHLLNLLPDEAATYAIGKEFTDLVNIIEGTELMDDQILSSETYLSDIYACKKVLVKYFDLNDSVEALSDLWQLIKLGRSVRKNCTKKELESLAELSLFMPARVFVYLACERLGLNFWREWEALRTQVYHDEMLRQYWIDKIELEVKKKRRDPIPKVYTSDFLYKGSDASKYAMSKKLENPEYHVSDDDRLYWYDNSNEVKISDHIDSWLKDLGSRHKDIVLQLSNKPYEHIVWSEYLVTVLYETNEYFQRIFAFQSMFYEFFDNGDRKEYIAAVVLLEQLAQENCKNGEEIQVVRYDWNQYNRNATHNPYRMRIKRYLSVLANRTLRKKYFDF